MADSRITTVFRRTRRRLSARAAARRERQAGQAALNRKAITMAAACLGLLREQV